MYYFVKQLSYQQPSMPCTTVIWQKLIAFYLLTEKAFWWDFCYCVDTMSNIPSQLAFQVCSPIKQVRLDLGQSENSCPSSILIPISLAFYVNYWSKWMIFCYFRAGFYWFLSILCVKFKKSEKQNICKTTFRCEVQV